MVEENQLPQVTSDLHTYAVALEYHIEAHKEII